MSRQERAAFGAHLRERRHERGLSQRELAEQIGVDPSMISRVEKGERELSATQLARARRVLGELDVDREGLDPADLATSAERIEEVAWALANTVRGAIPAAQATELVTTIAFLKYASDVGFPEVHGAGQQLEAHWETIAEGDHFTPSSRIRRAWQAHERDNPFLRGAFDDEALLLAPHLLPEIVAQLSDVDFSRADTREADRVTPLAQFIDSFITAYGPRLGDFATPASIVSVISSAIERSSSDAFDPACGTGTLLGAVSAHPFEAGAPASLGQEISQTMARVALVNLAAQRSPAQVALGDSLRDDAWANLRAEVVVSNPPFRQRGWSDRDGRPDARWRYGTPPASDATFAWLQHALHHLQPAGRSVLVLPIGALWQAGPNASIRRALVEAGELTALIALPGRLFGSTAIESCLWIVDRALDTGGAVLMVDASSFGRVKRRRGQIALADDEIDTIASTYRAWTASPASFEMVPGIAAVVSLEQLRQQEFALHPSRYVRSAELEPEDARERLDKLARALKQDSQKIADLERSLFPLLKELAE